MPSHRLVNTLKILPSSYRHVLWVTRQLKNNSYENILSQDYSFSHNTASIHDIVKSYFWASRLISYNHCLARSVALYQNLINRGFNVEHKFGVNNSQNQFKAHAWVEYQRQPLNEHPDLRKRFKVLEKHK
jgi:hypothetical protein